MVINGHRKRANEGYPKHDLKKYNSYVASLLHLSCLPFLFFCILGSRPSPGDILMLQMFCNKNNFYFILFFFSSSNYTALRHIGRTFRTSKPHVGTCFVNKQQRQQWTVTQTTIIQLIVGWRKCKRRFGHFTCMLCHQMTLHLPLTAEKKHSLKRNKKHLLGNVRFSLSLSVSPSLRLSVSPSLRLSVSPSLRLSVSPSLRLSVSPSLRLSVSPSLRLSVSPSLRLSVSPSLRLSVSPSLSEECRTTVGLQLHHNITRSSTNYLFIQRTSKAISSVFHTTIILFH